MKFKTIRSWPVSILGTFVIILSTFFSHFAQAEVLVEQDPAREWQSLDYADTLYLSLKNKYPDLELTFDDRVLKSYIGVEWTPRDGLQNARESRSSGRSVDIGFLRFVKNVLPHHLAVTLNDLQAGERIQLIDSVQNENRENALRAWLMSQNDGSVEPHEYMAEAVRIANGNIIEAWIHAWNVARHGWKAAMTRNYGEISRKFVSMTGERHLWQGAAHYVVLPESEWRKVDVIREYPSSASPTVSDDPIEKKTQRMKLVIVKRGDEFSYLYHRIGLELFTMLSAKYLKRDSLTKLLGKISALGEFFIFTKTAGLEGERNKRLLNDLSSVDSAIRLMKLVHGKVQPREQSFLNGATGATAYLKSNPSNYGRKYQLPNDGRPAAYFGIKADPKYWAPTMSIEEMKFRFYHAVYIDGFVLDPILLASNGDLDRLQSGLRAYERSQNPDAELNSLMRQWLQGPRTVMLNPEIVYDLNYSYRDNLEHLKETAPEMDFKALENRLNAQVERVLVSVSKPKMFGEKVRYEVRFCSTIFK